MCEIQLIAERAEYANHYRYWALDRAGTTVKNIGYSYHESTAAEVINELNVALTSCREWVEVNGTAQMIVPNIPVPRPEGLSQFLAFCRTPRTAPSAMPASPTSAKATSSPA
jgi:hypothetical protein